VWFRSILVHVRNVPLAQHQGGHGRVSYGNGIVQSDAQDEQMEFLGSRTDGRHRSAGGID
jgi:hypothetical protein